MSAKSTFVNNSQVIKRANEYLVLQMLRPNVKLSVEELVQSTRISRQTVINILRTLEEKKVVVRAGLGESMGGRQPILYALNSGDYFAVGVDIEVAPIRLSFANLKEEVVFSKSWECNMEDSFEMIEDSIVAAFYDGLHELNATKKNIIGMCIGIPGRVDISKNLATAMDRIRTWEKEDIGKDLEDRLGVNIILRNNTHLLAESEQTLYHPELQDFLYIARRIGIGMGVFIGGKSYEGPLGNSGFIGHIVFDPKGEKCICGKCGCLETYAKKDAIEQAYKKQKSLREIVGYSEILKLADDGESDARAVLDEAATKMGIAISNAMLLYDITNVIIGDHDCADNDYFFEKTKSVIKQITITNENREIVVLKGELRQDQLALGGCLQVIKKFFSSPKLKLKSTQL